MAQLFTTKEVARFLGVNEKMVYSLVAEKGLPATKVTGKWIFPRDLVEQWIETNTVNYPEAADHLPPYQGLLIITGSNDILLDRAISLFNSQYPGQVAVFGNLGSMGGLRALRQNLCHVATSHLLQENEKEYNFDFATKELDRMPAIVNFCHREQGIMIQKGNPKNIIGISDFAKPGVTIVNRPLSTGTRLLLDRELSKAGINTDKIKGYQRELSKHMDAGIEVLSGRADAAPGVRSIAGILGLDFISLRWERFDLMISKDRFFDEGVQRFIGLLIEDEFKKIAMEYDGYDLKTAGKMVYPGADNNI
ncbi:MAG: helix-turn-helix transcriptional regulator [Desulfobacterales bacterium]|nr:helix-turn-helix transcriptional regulator [Desulfobacterales bacterium]